MKIYSAIIFPVVILFLLVSSVESMAFRCGNGLVTEGDSKSQVLATCGSPTSKEKSCENNQQHMTTDKYGKIKKVKKCGRKLETWSYNCGDNDFIYKIKFDDGKIINITTDGRGKGRSDCQAK
ncbi:hypothetical protein ASZ90_006273 [hydrocarbon metagenome]|uniref:DUF2845 domain-containing protein n=1 Tax=hydrocarbon metagenome TaxID=938273 RepID=A0A0W8FSS0_9ZZZZ